MTDQQRIDSVGLPAPVFEVRPTMALDMTVTNRSNDLVWGMLGANYVHFTVLQEYMASRLGVEVGVYHHITNNLHVYVERKDWKPQELLNAKDPAAYNEHGTTFRSGRQLEHACEPVMPGLSLVKDPKVFERELQRFCDVWPGRPGDFQSRVRYTEPFLDEVARPILSAHNIYKMSFGQNNDYSKQKFMEAAVKECLSIKSDDWRIAAQEWLCRRMKNAI